MTSITVPLWLYLFILVVVLINATLNSILAIMLRRLRRKLLYNPHAGCYCPSCNPPNIPPDTFQ